MAPLSLGGFFGGEMRVPGHANLAECQRGSKGGAPLAKGYLGGIPPGIFEKYFLLARRDPAKSIVETVLSRKPFFKNLGFSKMWDPGIWQSATESAKWRPLGYHAYAVKSSIPGDLIFQSQKEGPGLAPLSLGGFFGGECTFPDTQISQSTKAAPKEAPPFGEGIFGGNTVRHFSGIHSPRATGPSQIDC